MRYAIPLILGAAGMLAASVAAQDKPPCPGADPILQEGATGGLKGTVKHPSVKKCPTLVYIEEIPGKEFKPPEKNPVMDQKDKVFVPRILPVLVGTTVDFVNSDDFEHNVFSPDGETYNLGNWGKGEKRSYTFKRPGAYVQLCKLHPEMVGYVVVLKTPYFAIADDNGNFRISDIPPGTWKAKVWNERLKPKQLDATYEVTLQKGAESEIEIKP
ncbi:MAG: hypothetical protein HY716_06755 [Planctomycetes bacterium]|nr:hypothetical protein [Planctomycetota bacterium]